jgi:hypothetical protein
MQPIATEPTNAAGQSISFLELIERPPSLYLLFQIKAYTSSRPVQSLSAVKRGVPAFTCDSAGYKITGRPYASFSPGLLHVRFFQRPRVEPFNLAAGRLRIPPSKQPRKRLGRRFSRARIPRAPYLAVTAAAQQLTAPCCPRQDRVRHQPHQRLRIAR